MLEPRNTSCRLIALAIVATISTGLIGCAQSQYSRQNEKFRFDSLEWASRMFAKHETDRPQELEVAAHHVDRRVYYNSRQLKFNLEAAEYLANQDIHRFQTRPPVYGEKAAKLFWAKPDTIEWTTITLFW